MVRTSPINIPNRWEKAKVWTHNKEGKQVAEENTCPMRKSSNKSQKQPNKLFYLRIRGRRGHKAKYFIKAKTLFLEYIE
jgi:hypothetical protein